MVQFQILQMGRTGLSLQRELGRFITRDPGAFLFELLFRAPDLFPGFGWRLQDFHHRAGDVLECRRTAVSRGCWSSCFAELHCGICVFIAYR